MPVIHPGGSIGGLNALEVCSETHIYDFTQQLLRLMKYAFTGNDGAGEHECGCIYGLRHSTDATDGARGEAVKGTD